MNNRFKFRVWDKKLNKFVPWSSLLVIDFNSNEYIFQQFTGLKDKNGKEIYEGDILIGNWCKGWFREHKHKNKSRFQVIWLDKGFELKPLDYCNNSKFRTFPLWEDLEIIGNIFQNPELLK